MRKLTFMLLFVALLSGMAVAQKSKPWTEWTKKDVDKLLNESAWGQTQTETDTSELTFRPTAQTDATRVGANRDEEGAKNQAVDLKYRIRFFSAKPIREAFARKLILENPKIVPAQLQSFIEGDYSEMIVLAVTAESADRRYMGPVEQAFASATTGTLKNQAYLERKDGKRIFLEEYAQPGSDGTGAKFVFPRVVDGQPFLTAESDNVRFVADFGKGIKISWKFKLSDMTYNGKLEY